jgi:hypothetical protein
MRTRTLAALILLAVACTTSDKLIVTQDGGDSPDSVASTGGSGGPATGGAGTGGAPQGGAGVPPDAAAQPDAPPQTSDAAADLAKSSPDAITGDTPGSALTCAELPACGAGMDCFCCSLGVRIDHCTCSVACTSDGECPAALPHCNVKKTNGIPIGKGFCTDPGFFCAF